MKENQNNLFRIKINAEETALGNLTDFKVKDNEANISSGISKIKVIFYTNDIFRIWLAPDGDFIDPTDSDIVINYPNEKPLIKTADAGEYYKLESASCVLSIYKTPISVLLCTMHLTSNEFGKKASHFYLAPELFKQ